MPGSRFNGKESIRQWIKSQDINKIVDVGAGGGTYPKLLGEIYYYIAIEIWEPYVEMWNLKTYYDEIIIADIRDVVLPKADLIIFGDILEHLPKEDGLAVLKKALETYEHVVISIPLSGEEMYPGDEHYGNKHEKHISAWYPEDILPLAPWEVADDVGKQIGVFCI